MAASNEQDKYNSKEVWDVVALFALTKQTQGEECSQAFDEESTLVVMLSRQINYENDQIIDPTI